MKIKKHLFIVICAIFSQIIFSQTQSDKTEKAKNDIVKFTSGTAKEGKVILRGIHNFRENGKIKLCDNNYKNCTKYKIKDISEIIINSSPDDNTNIGELFAEAKRGDTIDLANKHAEFKILYNPKRRPETPLASKLVFEGKNHNFYSYSIMMDRGPLSSIYITEKESNLIKFKFSNINNKKTVKELNNLFSNCSGIAAESKKKRKELKKKSLLYFLKMVDKCL